MKTLSLLVELSLMGVLAALGATRCLAVQGNSTATNRFAIISERNMFGLRKPPEVRPQEAPKPPVNIKLTGFEQHGSQPTRVLLAEVPKDPKEQMKYFNLGEGEMEGGVEVLKIQPGQKAVDVVIDGVPEELTVKSNSFVSAIAGNGRSTAPPPGPSPRRLR